MSKVSGTKPDPIYYYIGENTPAAKGDVEKEYFPTPLNVVRSGVRAIAPRIVTPKTILDPGAGNTGRWGLLAKELFNAHLTGVELRDVTPVAGFNRWFRGDFLSFQDGKYDLIIGNPPFSMAQEFIEHSLDLSTSGGATTLFLRSQFLGGRERFLHLWCNGYLHHVAYCASRVAFISKMDERGKLKPCVDHWDYAIFVFKKQRVTDWTGSWWDYKNSAMKPRKKVTASLDIPYLVEVA